MKRFPVFTLEIPAALLLYIYTVNSKISSRDDNITLIGPLRRGLSAAYMLIHARIYIYLFSRMFRKFRNSLEKSSRLYVMKYYYNQLLYIIILDNYIQKRKIGRSTYTHT